MTYLEWNFIILAVVLALYYYVTPKSKANVYLFLTFGSVLFFNIFKDWKNMNDVSGYVPAFKYICRDNATFLNAGYYYKMQIGYYGLNKFLGFFSTSHYWFLFAIGCLTSLPYAYIIKKYSPHVFLSCLLYFLGFLQSALALRQYSAIGLTIMILPLLLKLPANINRKMLGEWRYIRLYIIILCLFVSAILIHPTAIIFLFVIISYSVKNTKWFLIMTIACGVILYFNLPYLTSIFVDNTSGYDVYLEAENNNNGGTLIINGFYLIASFYALRQFDRLPQVWNLLFKVQCVIFAFSIVSMASGGGVAIPRLLMYLTCFNCVFLPFVAAQMPNKMMRYTFVTFILFIAYYFFALSPRVQFNNMNIDASFWGF